jgi:hypothetical protein
MKYTPVDQHLLQPVLTDRLYTEAARAKILREWLENIGGQRSEQS